MRKLKPKLLVLNPGGEIAGIADVRVVGRWPHIPGAPLPDDHDFSDDSVDGDVHGEHTTPSHQRRGVPPGSRSRASSSRSAHSAAAPPSGTCWALGSLLYPSVPLRTWAAGAFAALHRAMSLAVVPPLVIRELPTPELPRTPQSRASSDIEEVVSARLPNPSSVPSLSELLAEEEHEVRVRRRRVRRKRAADSASKLRRSRRLAAKEIPFYVDATTKATRVKAAQLDMSKASERMKTAIADSGLLARPPPARISTSKMRRLGRICGFTHLSDLDDEVPLPA